ncbi:MAG: hypothetical protein PHN84_00685 [Desulfuromonadaceae bacterium]|nr:hypothetical protein [Desulfuromonadaceae bacterium]MDD2853954.1 hypothetical protein [Desulfuromonadaceae bacterium]
MNIKKTVAIATAVGALGALSVPAMALENEFHGMYRLRGMMTNFENAGVANTAVVPATSVPVVDANGNIVVKNTAAKAATTALKQDARTTTLLEQRLRLQYTAKASDDLKLVTHFEVDSTWGDAAYANGRGVGGGMAADSVNLETKNVYLDYNCPLTGANVKVGIQGASDTYKGIFFTDDVAGIFASKKIGEVKATAGFSRLYDYAGAAPLGQNKSDLYLLDAKLSVSKDITVGGAYYFLRDNQANVAASNAINIHVIGANAAVKAGIVSADAFLAYQDGTEFTLAGRDLSAWAGQFAVKANLDKAGTVHANVLYTSGGKATDKDAKAWQSLNSSSVSNANHNVSSNAYYDANMLLLMRSKWNMDSDKSVISTTNNSNHGVTLLAAGYDAKISDKLGASANIGYAMASQKDGADSGSIGTELNIQVDYKLFSNLTASFQGAFVVLGDGMNDDSATARLLAGMGAAKSADNPYLAGFMMNYTF